MHTLEAIEFYTKKQGKAHGEQSKKAYSFILGALRNRPTFSEAQRVIEWNAKNSTSRERRRIYRQALRDLSI